MPHLTAFTRQSDNTKTGPIPVTGTDKSSCPDACSFKNNGCYAEGGNVAINWRRINAKGNDWTALCESVASLPAGQLWRHNYAGDLPGQGDRIDPVAMVALVSANQRAGALGFTYTHKPTNAVALQRMATAQGRSVTPDDVALMRSNRAAIMQATLEGFTVNVSHDSLEELDSGASAVLPSVVVLPALALGETEPKTVRTPRGALVVVCPAQWRETTCDDCRLCQRSDRSYAIGFRAHGVWARKVSVMVASSRPAGKRALPLAVASVDLTRSADRRD